ncbi:MAG: hypothetical protein V4633_18835 [Pseudomonadota bacterium]
MSYPLFFAVVGICRIAPARLSWPAFQVLDFIHINFCLRNVHFVEEGFNTGFPGRPDRLIHNLIHNSCGYREKA